MDFQFLQDIREIVHGLGEKKPRIDTIQKFHSVLVKQMALLIYQTHLVAIENKTKIQVKHIIYVLKDYKFTIIRLLSHYVIKENMNLFTTANYIQELNEDHCNGNEIKKKKLDNDKESISNDIVENVLNFEESSELVHFDPLDILASIDFKSNILKRGTGIKGKGKKGIYNQMINALKIFKPDMKITKEDIINSKKDRIIRANELSLILSYNRYQDFGHCRTKNFIKAKGNKLLDETHKALPFGIIYNKVIRGIFLYLAKETLACLIDHIYKNRIFVDSVPQFFDMKEEDAILKVNKHDSILVPEVTLVVNSIWKESLGDMCIPYQENNKFFTNKLIFD